MDEVIEKKSYRKNWDEVSNLRFLVRFLEKTGMSIPQAAEVIGTTRQTVYLWLVKDDARFSVVNDLIQKCGYTLNFEISKRRDDSLIFIETSTEKDDKRLSFFADALREFDIPKEELSEKLDVGLTAVYYWFRVDDCFISYIFKTAQLYDLDVKINIRPRR